MKQVQIYIKIIIKKDDLITYLNRLYLQKLPLSVQRV